MVDLGNEIFNQKFQFHKGTIRTLVFVPVSCLFPDFNSIKVRLEPTPDFIRYAAYINFNSIKVRLELIKLNCNDTFNNIFQFHKGTIRTEFADFSLREKFISIP